MANAAPFVNVTLSPYNCVPGTDCTAALQQVIDDARAACVTAGGTPNSCPLVIYFPGALTSNLSNPNGYQTSKPLLCDIGGVTFVGDSSQTSFLHAFHGGPSVIFGFSRDAGGTAALTAAYWPSNSGVLDGSQSATVGVRTNATDILSWSGSGFDCGPSADVPNFWEGATQLTIDFAAQTNDGKVTNVCGLDSWFVNLGGGEISVFAYTPDGVQHHIHWTCNTDPRLNGFHRYTIQLDVNAGTVNAWQDRVQLGAPKSDSSVPSGTSFMPNGDNPNAPRGKFYVGQLSSDLTVYGLKVTQGLLYNVSTTGSSQARIDAATLNDNKQFFTVEKTTCGLLSLTEGQNAYRREKAQGAALSSGGSLRNEAFYGLWWNSTLQGNGWCPQITLKDMKFQSDFYGGAVTFCHPNQVYIYRCVMFGGMRGVNSHAYFTSYTYNVHDTQLSGANDTAWYGDTQVVQMTGCDIPAHSRSAIRMYGGNLRYEGGLVSATSHVPWDEFRFIDGQSGGQFILDQVECDFEGGGPSNSYVNCDGQSFSAGTTLILRSVRFGTMQPGAVHVILNDPGSVQGRYLAFNDGCMGVVGTPVTFKMSKGASSVWRWIDVTNTAVDPDS